MVAFLSCHVAFLGFSVGVGAFIIGLSQISSFFSKSYMRQQQKKKREKDDMGHFKIRNLYYSVARFFLCIKNACPMVLCGCVDKGQNQKSIPRVI